MVRKDAKEENVKWQSAVVIFIAIEAADKKLNQGFILLRSQLTLTGVYTH